jgi:hypothetical protein
MVSGLLIIFSPNKTTPNFTKNDYHRFKTTRMWNVRVHKPYSTITATFLGKKSQFLIRKNNNSEK